MKRSLVSLAAVAIIAVACTPGSSSAPSASEGGSSSDPSAEPSAAAETGEITVWVDQPREAVVNAYIEAHPEAADRINIELIDAGGVLKQKVLLFNNTGSGWPDVVFSGTQAIASVADASADYTMDLREYVSDETLAEYAEGANAPCELPDGRLICLRNDLAQSVLWYNQPLLEEFGYEVPATWEEYIALGEQVAEEHPGYIMGHLGDLHALYYYFWPSGCPLHQLVDVAKVYINTAAPECTRVAQMLDHLIALGVVSKFSAFSPEYAAFANENKLLMMPGAAWFGDFIFGGNPDALYYKESNNQLAVAPPPYWEDQSGPVAGAGGGGAWAVSRHTESPLLATDLAIWVTTDVAALTDGGTYPAALEAAEAWGATYADNPLYAEDPFPVLQEAAPLIEPNWGNVRFAETDPWNVLLAAVNEGATIESQLEAFGEGLKPLAEAEGYEVVTSR